MTVPPSTVVSARITLSELKPIFSSSFYQEGESFQELGKVFKSQNKVFGGEVSTYPELAEILGKWVFLLAEKCRASNRKGIKTLNVADIELIKTKFPELGDALGSLGKDSKCNATTGACLSRDFLWRKPQGNSIMNLIEPDESEVDPLKFGNRLSSVINNDNSLEGALKLFKLDDVKAYLSTNKQQMKI